MNAKMLVLVLFEDEDAGYVQGVIQGCDIKVDAKGLCPIFNDGKAIYSKKRPTSRLLCVPKVKNEDGQSSNLEKNVLEGKILAIRKIDGIDMSSKLR